MYKLLFKVCYYFVVRTENIKKEVYKMIELKSITKYYIYEGDNITYYNDLNIAVKKYITALKNSKNDIIFFGIQYSNGEYGRCIYR